ncbi:hypothetical protein GI374_01545 [Paracoccus sp. S-4012]|uniref:hypothetical protein n=1 Tax=Paracoccus sp. S-4012 TaxID=2665648 RepID=UPI0012AF5823|nr:hypothetical protein [Paracoccus sp. S-4012]MRX49142.1 hypothetical protein [Paracoccus sp. S-4012]
MIRPELAARLAPWRPAAAASTTAVLGAWLFTLGGWILWPVGAILAAVGVIWLGVELNHLRLRGGADGQGLVEIEEGAVRYYAARALGGEVALRDLAEIRILRLGGRPHWRLRTREGEALLIPADAAGAGALADGFAALPGADLGRLAAALERAAAGGPSVQTVWTAPHRGPSSP